MEELVNNFEKYKIDYNSIFIPKTEYMKLKIDEFSNLNNMITDLIDIYSNYDNEEYYGNFSLLLKLKLDKNMENIIYYSDLLTTFHTNMINKIESIIDDLPNNKIDEIKNNFEIFNEYIRDINIENNTHLIEDLLYYFNKPETDIDDDDKIIEFLNISESENYYRLLLNFTDAYADNYDDYYENNELKYKIVFDDNYKNTLDKIYPYMSYKEENIKDPIAFFLYVKTMNVIANDIFEMYNEIINLIINLYETNEYFLDFLQSIIDEIIKLENKDLEEEKEYYTFLNKRKNIKI